MNLDIIQKIHWTLYQTPSGVSSPPIYPSLDTLIYNLYLTYNGGLAIKTQLTKTQNSIGKSLTNNYLDVINKQNQLEKSGFGVETRLQSHSKRAFYSLFRQFCERYYNLAEYFSYLYISLLVFTFHIMMINIHLPPLRSKEQLSISHFVQ